MKDFFPGYSRKSEVEINKIWQNGKIMFDTNVLLNCAHPIFYLNPMLRLSHVNILYNIFTYRIFSVVLLGMLMFCTHFQAFSQDCGLTFDDGANVTLTCGEELDITLSPNNGGPFTYEWAGPNGFSSSDPQPAISVAGEYTLTINGENCDGEVTATIDVTIDQLNNMANAGSDIIKCEGETVMFNLPNNGVSTNPNQNGTGPYTYSWEPVEGLSDPTVLNPECSVTATTTYTLTVTDANGCSDTDQMNVSITLSAVANLEAGSGVTETDFNGVATFYKCGTNTTTNFNFSDPTGGDPGSVYTISWGDGTPDYSSSTQPNPIDHVYAIGIYDLTYTIEEPDGCVSIVNYQVFYGSNPAVGLGNPGNTNVCSPSQLTFPITGTENNASGTIYTVTFNDGSPAEVFNHPPPTSITHTFQTGSCGITSSDGQNDYENSYQANIVAENPCGTSSGTIVPIIVNTSPSAGFTIDPYPISCTNTPVQVTSTATAEEIQGDVCLNEPPTVWEITPAAGWSVTSGSLGATNGFDDFGVNWDPTSWAPGSQNLTIVFNEPGTYTIDQLVGISCGFETNTDTICIEAPPVPDIILDPISGCTPLEVNSTNNSQLEGCDVTFEWSAQQLTEGCPPQPGSIIYDGQLLEPEFEFIGQGTYEVTFTATNSCGSFDQTISPITVDGPPIIDQSPLEDICASGGCVFPSATTDDCGLAVEYAWSFPGGIPSSSNQQNPGQVCYDNPSTYSLTASATNICGTSESIVEINVFPLPEVDAGDDLELCEGDVGALEGSASGGAGGFSYQWTPGTGLSETTVLDPDVDANNDITYTLTVTDASGCIGNDDVNVIVFPPATADANGPYNACEGLSVELIANSSGSGSWSAPPGTGTFSDPTSTNTTFTPVAGQADQTITVTWTTDDPDGAGPCGPVSSDALVTVLPPATANIMGPFVMCSDTPIEIDVESSVDGSWTTTGSGTFGNDESATTTYTPSASDIGSTIEIIWNTIDPDNALGPCEATSDVSTITINEAATADTGGPYATCGVEVINIVADANGEGSWTIVDGNGFFSNATNQNTDFQVVSPIPGTVTLEWTTDDPDGNGPCQSVTSQTDIVVDAPPFADINGPYIVCSNGSVEVSVETNYDGNWSTTGSGTFDNPQDPTTFYTPGDNDNGTIDLTWTSIDPDGPCEPVSDVTTIEINEAASASPLGPFVACGEDPVSIDVDSSLSGSWSILNGDGIFEDANQQQTLFTPSSVGIIELQWTTGDPDGDGPCELVTVTETITINEPAVANIDGPFVACSNLPVAISVTSNTSGSWTSSGDGSIANINAESTTYTPAPQDFGTTITLTWTTDDPDGNGPCISAISESEITFNEAATASIEGPFTTCGSDAIEVVATTSGAGEWGIVFGEGSFDDPSSSTTNFVPDENSDTPITIAWTTNDPDGNGPCTAVSDETTIDIFPPATAVVTVASTLCSNEPIEVEAITNSTGSWSSDGEGMFDDSVDPQTSYIPAAEDALNSPIVLTWTTDDPDGDGPCEAVADSEEIEINIPPAVDAGPDFVLCLGNGDEVLNGQPAGGAWIGNQVNEDGVFSPLNPGVYELIYEYTDQAGCSDADTLVINVNQSAIAEAGGPYAVCGVQSIQLSAITNGNGEWSGGAGAFDDPANPEAIYTPDPLEVGITITLTWDTFDPDGDGPCDSATSDTELTISTPATAVPSGPYTICSSDIADIEVTSTPDEGSWSGGSGNFGDSSSASTTYDPDPSETGSTVLLTWTTVDPDGDGPCLPVSTQVEVNVLEEAIAEAGGPYAVCGVQSIQLDATTNGNGEWSGGIGSFDDPTDPEAIYIPDPSEVGTTITLTWDTFDPDGDGPCDSATSGTELTISTPATAEPGGPYTICSSDIADIEVTTTPGGGSWSGGSGIFGDSSGASTTYDPDPSETGSTVVLTWTTIDPDGDGPCQQVSTQIEVNVLEEAIAEAGGPYAVCGAESIQLSANTNGNGEWSGGAGAFDDPTDPEAIYTPDPLEVGTTITLTWDTFDPDGDGPCDSATSDTELTISTPATAVPSGAYTICSSDIADIEVTSTPDEGSWSGGSGNFGDSSSASTTYDPDPSETGSTVELTWTTVDPDGDGPCLPVSTQVEVNVLEEAIAEAGGPYAVCGVQSIQLSATTNGNGEWNGGAGAFNDPANPEATYTPDPSEVGTTITLTWDTFDPDGDGPCDSATSDTELTISTPATAEPGGPYTICSSDIADIEVTSTPDEGSWSGGFGSFNDELNPSTTYDPHPSETGTGILLTWTTVDPDGDGPCLPVNANVPVNILAEATATIFEPNFTCADTPVEIAATANGAGEWSISPVDAGVFEDVSDPSTIFTPTVDIYISTTVTLEWITFDPDGDGPCSAFTTTSPLDINEIPLIDLTPSFEIDCGDEIEASISGGTTQDDYEIEWAPQEGIVSPGSNPTPVNAAGQYTLTVTDDNGCSNQSETEVELNELDQMAAADDVELCFNEEVVLTGTATLGTVPFTYQWTPTDHLTPNNGDEAEVNFIYNEPDFIEDSTFILSLFVTDAVGCTDEEQIEVLVHPLPIVEAGLDTALCAYASPFFLTDYSPLEFEGQSGTWTPSGLVNPSELPVGPNTFQYTFTDFNGCTNSDQLTVTIHEVPVASFAYPEEACENEAVVFSNTSTCATCGPLELNWNFNEEATSNLFAPTHTFSDTGFVNIDLGVTSIFGCVDSITETMHILALPETSFSLSENGICGPVDITLDNTTIGSELSFDWNIEPLGLSQEEEPGTLTFPAAPCDSTFYQIDLTATNICGSTGFTDSLLVYSLAQPDFVFSADTVCSEQLVEIYNSTDCAWQTIYQWDLGDGNVSNSQDLEIANVYTTGIDFTSYPVTLTATNPCGVTEYTEEIVIAPIEIEAFFNADPISGCEPLEVNFDQEMFGVTYFGWDFGDGSTSSTEDPQHTFLNDGAYLVEFIVGNFCGAEDTAYQTINVLPAPLIDFISTEQFLCVGEATQFIPSGDPITGHNWSFGDGNTSTQVSPGYIYEEEGFYEVTLDALSSINGCPNSVTDTIQVITTPVAQISTAESEGCPPFNAVLTNDSENAVNFFWDLGDGNFFVGDTLAHTFMETGDYEVQIIAINSNSCTDTTSLAITVYPQPIADFAFETFENDFNLDVDFENLSQDAVAYEWTFGDGNDSYFTDPFHSYEKTGNCIYYPQLIAYNLFNCTDTAARAIEIPLEMRIWAPNAFSPDNDGINDIFSIVTSDVATEKSRLAIFNRWGVLIHEDIGFNPSWDGYIDGKLAKNDLYVWKYSGREKCGEEEVNLTGHVVLIK
jgi:gliding motility-associated-like protein